LQAARKQNILNEISSKKHTATKKKNDFISAVISENGSSEQNVDLPLGRSLAGCSFSGISVASSFPSSVPSSLSLRPSSPTSGRHNNDSIETYCDVC